MRIGATATHTFELGAYLDVGDTAKKFKVIYAQNGAIKLEKEFDSATDNKLIVNLTSQEVAEFSSTKLVQVQVCVSTTAGKAYTSDIMNIKVYDGLDKDPFDTNEAVSVEEE